MISLPFGFSLLNSLALLGLLSLCVPLIIHLLNPNRGKIVLIGNIDLISQSKTIRVLNLQLTQWLLLILRLLILIFLTLILSSLVKNIEINPPQGTHVFVSEDWLAHSNSEEKNRLFTQHSENQIFLLASNFPKLQQPNTSDTSQNYVQERMPISIQALFTELENSNIFAQKNIIYTTNQLSQYLENKISSPKNNIEWKIKQVPETTIQDSLINVAIFYSPSRELDFQYLKLGLETLSKFSKFKLKIYQYTSLNLERRSLEVSENQSDWIFWLSDEAIHPKISNLASFGKNIFSDLNSEQKSITNQNTSIKIARFDNRFFHSLPNASDDNSTPIWQDHNGKVALSSTSLGHGIHYQFNSRFHPRWSDLTASIKFPLILAKILATTKDLESAKQISSSEIQAYFQGNTSEDNQSKLIPVKAKPVSSQSILMFIICLLWLIERLVAEKLRIKP